MTGFDVELLRRGCAKAGIERRLPRAGLQRPAAERSNQQIDLAAGSISITTDRLKMVAFLRGLSHRAASVASLPIARSQRQGVGQGQAELAWWQGTIEDTYSASYLPGALIVRFPNVTQAFSPCAQNISMVSLIDKSAGRRSAKQVPPVEPCRPAGYFRDQPAGRFSDAQRQRQARSCRQQKR